MAMLAAEEPPAIRKLGRLFKLTEVHLWDDSCGAGANVSHKHWRCAETGFAVSQTDKTSNKPAIQTDEGHSFVEDLELANLMGSLGLPVSFSTSKEKIKTAKKGKKKGRQALCEAANTPMDDAVRTMDDAVRTMDDAVTTCTNTKEIESVVELMACVQHINSCSSSRTDVGYNEAFHDDIGKMLGEDSFYVVEREESGCSAEIVTGDEAENHSELRTCRFKSDSPVRENQAADCVLQLSKEMLGQNSVDNESRISCAEIFQEGRSSTRDDQISGETPSISHDNNDVVREACLNSAEPSPVDNHAQKSDSNFYYEYGDWKVLWDPLYSRYYFYNILTQESTWYPPQGLEDFASYCSTFTHKGLDKLGSQYTSIHVQEHSKSPTKFDQSSGGLSCADNTMDNYISKADQHGVQYAAQHLSTCDDGKETFDQAGDDRHLDGQGQDLYNESHNLSEIPIEERTNRSVITTIDEAQHAENTQNGSSMTEVIEMNQDVAGTKKKKRVRRAQSYHSCQDFAGNISNDIAKYWAQRYSLFSLYDSGIKMDEEGWFSVTPEPIAKHHASRVGGGVVIDCFTGVGGNAIQFATKCKHVIAVDIDPQKIDCAQHNATIYGVNGNIDFVVGDFIHIAPHLKGETAFMSPPWGGPDYAKVDVYDIKAMLKPCDGYSLFKLAMVMASRVVMFLPRNIDLNQLADMCLSVDPPWAVEVERNFLNGKLKAITAYFEEQDGSDVHHIVDTDHRNYVE